MSVVDHSGTVQLSVPLPQPPSAPLILEDINGDGINDIILTTKDA